MNDYVNSDAPDPRAHSVVTGDRVSVQGVRCVACGFPTVSDVPRCPVCGSAVEEANFGSEGSVFASTVLRIRLPDRTPPYGLAYLILDDGPRVLVHTPTDHALPVGSRARIASFTTAGDLFATPIDEEVAS